MSSQEAWLTLSVSKVRNFWSIPIKDPDGHDWNFATNIGDFDCLAGGCTHAVGKAGRPLRRDDNRDESEKALACNDPRFVGSTNRTGGHAKRYRCAKNPKRDRFSLTALSGTV